MRLILVYILFYSHFISVVVCDGHGIEFNKWKHVIDIWLQPGNQTETEFERKRYKRSVNETFILYGIRARGESVKIVGNRITVGLNSAATLILLGKNLEKTKLVITPTSALKGTTCDAKEYERSVTLKRLKESVYELTIVEHHFHVHHFCLQTAENKWIHQGNDFWLSYEISGPHIPIYIRVIFIVTLLMFSALFSGLGIGLMALDKNEVKVLARCGNERDRNNAKAIQPLRENGNFLLCSLIIANTVVNAALTVLLNSLTTGLIAVVIATLSIVIIGEILPQALCSRYGLYIGAKTIYITYFVMIITSPASYPLSKLLDWILGEEIGKYYNRECLQEYIQLTKNATRLEDDEINVIKGAFQFNRKTVAEAMTPLDQVYMIPINEKLDAETVCQITQSNFSRIPVYAKERSNIVGILYVKDLMLYTAAGVGNAIPIETIVKATENQIEPVPEDERLKILLDKFKQGKCHMALVKSKQTGKVIGVVTMEDVLEEIFQEEIIDETDIIIDPQKRLTRKGAQKNISYYFKIGEPRSASYFDLSPQLLNAIYLFLSTSLKPFSSKYMSEAILRRLITQQIYHEVKVENTSYQDKSLEPIPALYTSGVVCDYFILLIEGKMMATFGKEAKSFECKPFTYFGVSALEISDNELNNLTQKLAITGNPNKPFAEKYFTPDFTLKVIADCLYMKITRTLYLTACRAHFTDQRGSIGSQEQKSLAKNPSSSLKQISKKFDKPSKISATKNL